jgi:hypothetical protein
MAYTLCVRGIPSLLNTLSLPTIISTGFLSALIRWRNGCHSGTESKSVIIKNITGTDGLDREGSEIGDQDSTALGVEQGSITPKDQL